MRTISSLFFAVIFFGCAATDSQLSSSLVGRWRAELVPTGYWIIDRFPDGRFAEKGLLKLDYDKPAEIYVAWGRWRIKNGLYQHITDGSTSEVVNQFLDEWRDTEFDRIESDVFHFRAQEGLPRREFRIQASSPISQIVIAEPEEQNAFYWSRPKHGIIETSLVNLPAWIDSLSEPEQ